MTDYSDNPDTPSRGSRLVLPILYGAVIALAGFSVYTFLQVDKLRGEIVKLRESVLTEITNVRDASSVSTDSQRRHLDALREELDVARRNATLAAGQARTEALKHAEDLARKLEAEQQRQQQAVKSELSAVKEAASATNAKIADVSTDVTSVKSEVASTKSDLEKTISELKSVRGDLGVQSGLVATNSRELNALKTLGDRNYFEFKLGKSKEPQKVGDITLKLKKADAKRNRYTVEVVADDKLFEKKDRTVNEPVQFYVSAARQPYELVVNQVAKDLISGYLATPKVRAARN